MKGIRRHKARGRSCSFCGRSATVWVRVGGVCRIVAAGRKRALERLQIHWLFCLTCARAIGEAAC